MNKCLSMNSNEEGFYLPYITFICMLVLMMASTSIILYQNHLQMTHKMMEWTRVETLVQMTTATFINDELYKKAATGEVNLTFPDGTVDMAYEKEADGKWLLYLQVKTNRDFLYTDYYMVHVRESVEEEADTS